MKIIQIATGLITIPPNGWGAVERIIWEYKQKLEALGNEVDIRYINQMGDTSGCIVHAHLANLALNCRDMGIPYIYSLHDHHVEWYGKDSWIYKQNLDAIKGSIISLTHTEHYVDYFDGTDKLFYLTHGANTEFFTTSHYPGPHKILMIANNGLAGDSGFDRKGFRYGIEAAKELKLPITIAGHPDNQKFFEIHSDLLQYEKLTLKLTNPTDEEVRELYHTHSIFLHPSMLEAGHPNLTLCEAASSCVPIVGTYNGSRPIPGMCVIAEPTTKNVLAGLVETINSYEYYKKEMITARDNYDWKHVVDTLNKYYTFADKVTEEYDSAKTKQLYINAYDNV